MTRIDKIAYSIVAVIAVVVVLLILFGCEGQVEMPTNADGMDVGDLMTLVIVFSIGLVMTTVGFAELRSYFRPSWMIGYRRDKPSFFSGIAWLAIGIICLGITVFTFCVGGK
jgi:uncharacterized membrane protein